MGGHAFLYHYTPPMPDKVYKEVAELVAAKLRTKFAFVLVTPSLPGKTEHGDIDICVASPLDGRAIEAEELGHVIDAIEVKTVADKKWEYFAVPWPDHLKAYMPARPEDHDQTRERRPLSRKIRVDDQDAIQIDIQQYSDPLSAEWAAYWTSFGNLRPIMNTILREFGILHQVRPDHKHNGLVLRPMCLEDAIDQGHYYVKGGKKACDVLLTSDPSAVLRFAGMLEDNQKWYDLHFETPDELAVHICTKNRFFDPDRLQKYQDQFRDETRRYRNPDKYYSFFDYLVNSFIPSCQEVLRSQKPVTFTRAAAESEACRFFPEARTAVEAKIHEAKAKYEPKMFWKALERELRLVILPEVVEELNTKRYGSFGTWLRGSCLWLKDAMWNSNTENLQATCISAEDQGNLGGLVSKRVSCVVRCVKGRTVGFDPRYAEAPTPYEYELWEDADYEQLLPFCLRHRRILEQDQSEQDAIQYANFLKRGDPQWKL